jgi:hypothetical protein
MFTIGIFSTHLPYIAFVFFYAFFFFFNVHNNTAEEAVHKETDSRLSVIYTTGINYYEFTYEQDEQSGAANSPEYHYQNFSQNERSGPFMVFDDLLITDEFFPANFSRPPPSA